MIIFRYKQFKIQAVTWESSNLTSTMYLQVDRQSEISTEVSDKIKIDIKHLAQFEHNILSQPTEIVWLDY